MSQSETGTGKTIELAVRNALNKLGASEEDVTVDVLQQPESGVFGLFGKKDAIVEVTLIEKEIEEPSIPIFQQETTPVVEEILIQEETVEPVPETTVEDVSLVEETETDIEEEDDELEEDSKPYKALKFLSDLFEVMGIDCDLYYDIEEENLKIDIVGDRMGIIIGRRGQTIDAIQYLTSLVINKQGDDYTRVILDTENYRDKRQQTLEALADKMASKAIRFRRKMTLEPMNPAERRIIHARLQSNNKVETYSLGQDPYRRVVIQPKYNRRRR